MVITMGKQSRKQMFIIWCFFNVFKVSMTQSKIIKLKNHNILKTEKLCDF